MKIIAKKILALLCSAAITLNALCTSVSGAEEAVLANSNPVRTESDVFVQGTNTFGNMLAAEIQSVQDEQIENNGQIIFSVEMEGKTATVEYGVTADCTVVVGIYDETSTTMLASGNADLSADESTAVLSIDTDNMPEYFYIKAFLVDTETMRPLSSVYESPMYTQEMQEFLAKTTEDFDADKVYNLDDDNTNNFAVFNDDVTVIHSEAVSSEEGKVVFDGITDELKSLSAGSTFAYYYDDELYIYSASAVTIHDGNNSVEIAYIDTEENELEDFFDYVKIDGESNPNKCTATPTGDADEGVTYLGMSVVEPEEANAATYSVNGDTYSVEENNLDVEVGGSANVSCNFKIEKEFKKASATDDDIFTGSGKFSASLKFSLAASAKVYITLSEQYVEVKLDYSAKLSFSFTGSVKFRIPLGQEIGVYICPGVYIGITPKFVAEFSTSITLEGTLSGTIGFKCDGNSIENLTTTPKFETKLKVEGKFFVGFSLSPRLGIIHPKIFSAGATAEIGAEITAKSDIFQADSYQLVEHDCKFCISGDVSVKATVGFDIKLLNLDFLKFEIKALEAKWKLFDFNFSNISGFNLETCKNKRYKTKIIVFDNKLINVNDAVISVDGNEISRGSCEAEVYLSAGTHKFKAESPSLRTSSQESEIKAVSTEPNVVMIVMYPKGYSGIGGISNSGGGLDDGDEDNPDINIPIEKKRLSLGGWHSAYITENGDLYTWGYNKYGQLGDGTTKGSCIPKRIMSNVAQVNLGGWHSACITTNGDLYTWGNNEDGQLGDGTTTDSYIPKKIMSNVTQVSSVYLQSSCITTNGDLYTWGYNKYGQLGDGTTKSSCTPKKIMSNVAQVSLGEYHSACITTNGDLYTWGDNYVGGLGDGTTTDSPTPQKIMSNVAQVNLGDDYSSCITTNGDLYTWGYNGIGELGDGTTTDSPTPQKIMSNVAQVSLGDSHSACITTNGDLYTWGSNCSGQLGDRTTTNSHIPKKIMNNVAQVSLGNNHSACITTNGDLYTWGWNYYGELGDGTTTNSSVPIKITIPAETAAALSEETFSLYSSEEYTLTNSGEDNVYRFTGLLPNEIYNIYSMDSRTAAEPFGADNLLYIDQKISDSDGNLSVEINTEKSSVAPEIFVKAMNGGAIENAAITSLEQSGMSVTVGWKAVEGADKYTVYTIRNGIFFKAGDTTEPLFTVNNLIPGEEYGFIVQTWINGEYSVLDKSDAVYMIPEKTSVPDKPQNIKATPGDSEITLSWNAVEKATSYKVYMIVDGELMEIAETAETSYTVTDLANGTEYKFLVRSCNETGESNYSESDFVSATPKVAIPEKPTVTATVGDSKVTLSWNAVEKSTSYKVYMIVDGELMEIGETAKTSYTVTDLTNGTEYKFLVRSCNETGESNYSESDFVSATPKVAIPEKPTVTATVGDSKVTLTWDKVEGATKYKVMYRINGTAEWTSFETTATSYTVKGLTNGKKYDFVVLAGNDSDWSEYADEDIVSATPVKPEKPTILGVKPGENKVKLEWKAVTGAEMYRVYIYEDGKYIRKASCGGTETSATIANLEGGKKYGFVVSAKVNGTWTDYTDKADLVYATPTAPAVIAKPTIVANKPGNYKVKLEWKAVEGAEMYRVYTYENGAYTRKFTCLGKRNVATVTSLVSGVKLGFVVSAKVGGTWTDYTDKADLVYATPTGDPAPVITGTKGGDGKVKISWYALSGAEMYRVYTCENGAYTRKFTCNGSTNVATVTGLTNGKEYAFVVSAKVGGVWTNYKVSELLVYATPNA